MYICNFIVQLHQIGFIYVKQFVLAFSYNSFYETFVLNLIQNSVVLFIFQKQLLLDIQNSQFFKIRLLYKKTRRRPKIRFNLFVFQLSSQIFSGIYKPYNPLNKTEQQRGKVNKANSHKSLKTPSPCVYHEMFLLMIAMFGFV